MTKPHDIDGAASTLSDQPDPLTPENLRCPYPVLGRMRAEAPVCFVAEQRLWYVTRYDDCEFVLTHPELFSSRESMSGANAFRASPDALAILRQAQAYPRVRALVLTDPPEHSRYRKIVQRALTPGRTLKELTPRLQQIIDELIAAFAADGTCEFVRQFAYPLPMRLVAHLLDVPDSEIDMLKAWSDDFISVQAGHVPDDRLVSAAKRVLEFEQYFIDKIEDRRKSPVDDFIGRLVAAEIEGEPLSHGELLSLLTQILVGGNESTTNLLGVAMNLVLSTDGLADELRADPSRIPDVVEEVLRFESPVQGPFRIATRDTDIGGVTVPAGAKLMVHLGSANRDENYYQGDFDPERDNRSTMSLAFGRGIHACIGQAFPRRETVMTLETILTAFPDLRLDPGREPERQELFGVRGMRNLHLIFTPVSGLSETPR